MRVLTSTGLGIAIWSLSLLWPEINKYPLWPTGVGVILVVGVILIFLLEEVLKTRHNGRGNDHPSQPIPITVSH